VAHDLTTSFTWQARQEVDVFKLSSFPIHISLLSHYTPVGQSLTELPYSSNPQPYRDSIFHPAVTDLMQPLPMPRIPILFRDSSPYSKNTSLSCPIKCPAKCKTRSIFSESLSECFLTRMHTHSEPSTENTPSLLKPPRDGSGGYSSDGGIFTQQKIGHLHLRRKSRRVETNVESKAPLIMEFLFRRRREL
jgi:hypothetical protein